MLKRRYSRDPDNPFGLEKEGREFVWRDANGGPMGAGQLPFLPPDFEPRERAILLEGETDTMSAWQALQAAPKKFRDKIAIVGLSGTNAWKERYAEELFANTKRVFGCFDNDDPYTNPDAAAATKAAVAKIRGDLGRKYRPVRMPQGVNDVAEFFMQYDWAAFQVLLEAAAKPKRYYKRLDIFQPVPETDWVIEDLIEGGVITLVAGDSGVGKSFLSMAAALAVSGDDKDFLGLNVMKHGPVLYVDEEQATALVLQRLAALGRGEQHRNTLEYLNYAGVDLFNHPELLLEEAIEIEPALIVIDTQSSVAVGAEENSNDDMTRLFRDALRPLARETGAAVWVNHHEPKDKRGPRGAGAIKAQSDQVLSVIAAESSGVETGRLNIFPSKPRRRTALIQAVIEGEMAEGYVRVKGVDEEQPF